MEVLTGLFDRMVLQRNGRDVSDAAISGRCDGKGAVSARITRDGRAVRGFARVAVGRAGGGKFTVRLKGLPVGGPYDVELRINGTDEFVRVADVLVGDVWILAGQSNMQGVGLLADREPAHEHVRAFYMDDRWDVAEDPIHNMYAAVDVVHGGPHETPPPAPPQAVGVGPGVSFGRAMLDATGVGQGLIACAHGGTSMSQWDPKLKGQGTAGLYGATVRRFDKCGGRVRGVIWYQGESDANPDAVDHFTERNRRLVDAMRSDFGDRRLPVVMVQIGRVANWQNHAYWNAIQDRQRRLPELIDRLAVVPAVDLGLDDLIHISGVGQRRLGRRMAAAMNVLLHGRKAGKPPLRLKEIRVEANGLRGTGDLIVEYENVVGELQSPGRPTGFTLTEGGELDVIYKVALGGPRAILQTTLPLFDLEPCRLSYGRGANPYCNITDAADRSLPVMIDEVIGEPRALTPFVTDLSVSRFVPGAGSLDALDAPTAAEDADFRRRTFAGAFCDLHEEIAAQADEDPLVYFACRLDCPERMELRAWLGYDGPVKLFIDGGEVHHDPTGTNPAKVNDAKADFTATPGGHTIVVALGSNDGRAWGVFLRLERLDVSGERIRAGDYDLPTVSPL